MIGNYDAQTSLLFRHNDDDDNLALSFRPDGY